MRTVLIPLAVSAILVIACGGGNDRATTIEQETPATTVTAPMNEQTTTPVLPTETPSPPQEQREDIAKRLPDALLTLEDMPTGWTVSPPDEDDEEDDGTDLCGVESTAFADPIAEAETSFQKAELGPFLVQAVDVYAEGQAPEVMADFLEAAQSCTEWTEIDEDGTETTWRLAPLSFPKLGDETISFRMSTITIIGPIEMDFIVWRRGDLIDVMGHFAFGFEGVDSDQTESFARLADEKLRRLE